MAEFITKCPHCNTELQAQDEWVGMEVECPECQKTFIVENGCDLVKTVANQPLDTNEKNCPVCGNFINAKASRCKFCKRDLTQTHNMAETQPLDTNEKNCPFCGNRINAKAIRCKFCKQNLTENIITFVPNHKNNGTSVWEKLTSLPPHVRSIGVGIIILLFLAICSGIFFVWNDNYLIKAWKIEKRFQAYSSWSRECSGESFSLSPVNVTLDNMGSFFAGFFFCYGEDTFRNKNR